MSEKSSASTISTAPNGGEFLLYQTEGAQTRIQVRLIDGALWLTQKQLSDLYQKNVRTISEHIRNIFADEELSTDSSIRKFRIVATEGARNVERLVDHYSLEMVLAVGYRVRSHRGAQFRRWATEQLKSYLVKGFVLDDERFKRGDDVYFDELLARIRDIRSSEKVFWKKVLDIYATSIDYDPSAESSQHFFATMQNKMHWAAHGHTAAEVIVLRANAAVPNMGLTSWAGESKGGMVRKADGIEEKRLEDYVVSGLVDFDDISYDDHADLLYDLATQAVAHFCSYLSETDAGRVLRCFQRPIAKFIHVQMQAHSWEDVVDYEVVVSKGYTEFKSSAYTFAVNEPQADYLVSPADKSNMSKYVFGGFKRCLYPVQKFDSEAERVLAVILDRDAAKWFKPARGQFQIYYKQGADHLEYQPDFVAETDAVIYMLEPKASNQMSDVIVLAKMDAAIQWCKNASDYALANGGKAWRYVLIPHTSIAVNMTLDGLAAQFGCQ